VDELFQSLAASAAARAIAVVMSGTGSNGSAGLLEIKARGGAVFAQDPATAGFSGMPSNAIRTGHVDQVLAPAALAEAIARYVGSRYVAMREREEIEEACFNELFDLLRGHSKVELHSYRRPTIARRVARRMSLNGARQLEQYVALLRKNAAERQALSNDLMINVTSFFRDPASWEALEKLAIEPVVQAKEPGSYIRCWVTACSSGEEAYTLAMLLLEHVEAAGKNLDIRVFATDLSEQAIARARLGSYPHGISTTVSPERLERFFEKEDDSYRVSKQLRENVIFAPHNLLADPPFSHLDIATCRNVLIYLEPDIQRKVLDVLHFSLRPNGVLMLGSAESTHRDAELFEPLDRKHKIFRRVGPVQPTVYELPLRGGASAASAVAAASNPRVPYQYASHPPDTRSDLHAIALQAVAGLTPAAALLDGKQRVVYFHGRTDPYLAHPHGQANLDVYAMARAGLEAPVRAAITRARNEGKTAVSEAVIMRGDAPVRVSITATPLRRDDLLLLSFCVQEAVPAPEKTKPGDGPASDSSNASLQQELSRTNEDLARTIEDLEKSNEDLTASSEEVMSINEELQSTNEELETSKEELQSLNEELATVNSQLQNKLDELETTSSNLANLLKSSDIATLFLSREMKVMWFTPAVARLFSLIESDIGRPLTDFAPKFADADIHEDCRQVLKTLVPVKKEVKDDEGRWYLRRTTPYRTSEDRIDGVIITFVDITYIKEAERKMRHAATKARKAAAAKDIFLARLSHELRTPLQPALLGLSGISARKDLPGDVGDQLANITRNIRMEMRLIDDLLDLTRIGQGQLQLHREVIDALELVEDSVRVCRGDSARKRQHVVVEGTRGECFVHGDKIRLQQVIWNLLHNAIRFTGEQGTITVRCRCSGEQVFLEVSDDGAGIPQSLLPRIFESFERFDEALGGLGLGLSIAKSIVEAHGGSITAESAGTRRGATFRVVLPAAEAAAGTTKAPRDRDQENDADISGLRILVIEDHRDSAEMMAALLQAAGSRTEVARSMEEALQLVADHEFDLILSDLGLPDGSGYQLMADLPDDVPVIALSGFGSPQDKQRSRSAGFTEHLVKPITLSELRAAIARAMTAKEPAPNR
jgi:two-component system CheB/CheR fusion protein